MKQQFNVGDIVKIKEGEYEHYVKGSQYNLPRTEAVVEKAGTGYVILRFGTMISPPINPDCVTVVKRRSGYYWVKIDRVWEVAYRDVRDYWTFSGNDLKFTESQFEKWAVIIGPRLETPTLPPLMEEK